MGCTGTIIYSYINLADPGSRYLGNETETMMTAVPRISGGLKSPTVTEDRNIVKAIETGHRPK